DPGPATVVVDELDDPADRGAELLARVGRCRLERVDHDLPHLEHDAVVDGDDERVEVVEALVEVPGVQPRPLAPGPDPRPGAALGPEEVERRGDEQLPAHRTTLGRRDAGPAVGAVIRGQTSVWQRALP